MHKNKIFVLSAEGMRADVIKDVMADRGLRCFTTNDGDVVLRAENAKVSVNS